MARRTKLAIKSDKNFIASGVGERTSKKVSTIFTKDGGSFRRKNANQYGKADGGNDYTETRPNRTDKYETGGDLTGSPEFSGDEGTYLKGDLEEYAKGSTIKGRGKKKKTKKPKEPMVVRGYFEDVPYEYGNGGSTNDSCCYTIGGL